MAFDLDKDPEVLRTLATDLVDQWQPRNWRIAEDRRRFEGRVRRPPRDTATTDREELISANDARAHVSTAAALLAGKPPELDVPVDDPNDSQRAQRVENWLDTQREAHASAHAASLRYPLAYAEALSALVDGWLACRVLWRPPVQTRPNGELLLDANGQSRIDPEVARYPFRCTVVDPTEVYPMLSADTPPLIVRRTTLKVGQLKLDWPERWWTEDAQNYIGERKDRDSVEITEFYTDTHLAAMVGQAYLKKPTEHRYGGNPLIVTVFQGASWQKQADLDLPRRDDHGRYLEEAAEWQRFYGVGLVDAIREQIRNKEDILSMLRLIVAKMAAPPMAGFSNDPQSAQPIPRGVGEDAWYRQGEAVQEFPPPGQALQGTEVVLQQIQQFIWQGALGQAAFGGGPTMSGFDRTQATDMATKILLTFVAGLQTHYKRYYGTMLRLFGRFGVPSPFITMSPQGIRVQAPPLIPGEVQGLEYGVQVRYRSLNTQDRMASVQMAVQAVREGLVSPDTARNEYLDIQNPAAEEQKVLIAQARGSPGAKEARGYAAWRDQALADGNQNDADIADALLQGTLNKLRAEMQPMAPPPGAQPPVTGGGVPSGPAPGPPNPVLPDELGLAAGQVPNGGIPPGPAAPQAGVPALV